MSGFDFLNFKEKVPDEQVGPKGKLRKKKKKTQINLETEYAKPQVFSHAEKNSINEIINRKNKELPLLKLNSLHMSVMSREELDKLAVVNVTRIFEYGKDTTDTTEDTRMGVIDFNVICGSCRKPSSECPGHLGYIQLPESIIHPFYRQFVIYVLQSICNRCGKMIMTKTMLEDEGILNMSGYARIRKIAELSAKLDKRCGCPVNYHFNNSKAQLNDKISMPAFLPGKKKTDIREQFLKPKYIQSIFENIPPEDVKLLGFKDMHPKDYIVDFIVVIPPADRPPAIRDGEFKEHYLTSAYNEVLKEINYYNELLNSGASTDSTMEKLLHIYYRIIDNSPSSNSEQLKRNQNDVMRVIKDEISGKEALIRKHLAGKRVDFSARTVLGPNGILKVSEIGLPYLFRERLTIPETVTKYNIKRLNKLAKEGKINYITLGSGPHQGDKMRYRSKELKLGDIVERHSKDGDIFVFNRNPTLHKYSIRAYIARFTEKLTAQIHLSNAGGHNADFDGDEGAVHCLQTEEARIEARFLMSATAASMSMQKSAPIVGLTYNSIVGLYLLSQYNDILSEKDFNNGVSSMTRFLSWDTLEKRLKQVEKRYNIEINHRSNKFLISYLFPEGFNYNNNGVLIVNGIYLYGDLSKKITGTSKNGLVQSLWKWFGESGVLEFLSNANFLACWFAQWSGLTVHLGDCILPDFKNIKNYLLKEAYNLNSTVIRLPELSENATEYDKEERENKINEIISVKTTELQNYIKGKFPKDNNIKIMEVSGAKGKASDTIRLVGMIGQQYLNDTRPPKIISRGKRTLSWFNTNDKSIFSRGYSVDSFVDGMSPENYVFQAMAARIALSTKAIGTATIGFTNRKLVKTQEDLKVYTDGTIRNASKNIFQFSHGIGLHPGQMVNSVGTDGTKLLSFINIKELIMNCNFEGEKEVDVETAVDVLLNNL